MDIGNVFLVGFIDTTEMLLYLKDSLMRCLEFIKSVILLYSYSDMNEHYLYIELIKSY